VLKSTLCRKISSRWSQRWWWRSLLASWSATISHSHSVNLASAVEHLLLTLDSRLLSVSLTVSVLFCAFLPTTGQLSMLFCSVQQRRSVLKPCWIWAQCTCCVCSILYKYLHFVGFQFSYDCWYCEPYKYYSSLHIIIVSIISYYSVLNWEYWILPLAFSLWWKVLVAHVLKFWIDVQDIMLTTGALFLKLCVVNEFSTFCGLH